MRRRFKSVRWKWKCMEGTMTSSFGTSLFLRLRSSWTLFEWRFFSFNEFNFSCHGQWTLFFIRDIVPHHWHKKRLLDFCCWENVKGCLGEGRIWICSCFVLLRQNKNFKTLLKAVVKNGLFTVRLAVRIDPLPFPPYRQLALIFFMCVCP